MPKSFYDLKRAYSPAQLDVIRDLLKDEKDAEVAKALALAIFKSN